MKPDTTLAKLYPIPNPLDLEPMSVLSSFEGSAISEELRQLAKCENDPCKSTRSKNPGPVQSSNVPHGQTGPDTNRKYGGNLFQNATIDPTSRETVNASLQSSFKPYSHSRSFFVSSDLVPQPNHLTGPTLNFYTRPLPLTTTTIHHRASPTPQGVGNPVFVLGQGTKTCSIDKQCDRHASVAEARRINLGSVGESWGPEAELTTWMRLFSDLGCLNSSPTPHRAKYKSIPRTAE
jgi:hypothetical protein